MGTASKNYPFLIETLLFEPRSDGVSFDRRYHIRLIDRCGKDAGCHFGVMVVARMSFDDEWVPAGPVVAVGCEQPDPLAV
jgi:hypothetical protein